MLTRDIARQIWAETNLSVGDLDLADLSALRLRLDQAMRASRLIRDSFRMERRIRVHRAEGCLRCVELRCRSHYFEGRQAITFDENGFVGFAGWADDVNVQPVLEAFIGWARERACLPA